MIKAYVRDVQLQIASKEARSYISEEVEQHLQHSKQAYVDQGDDEQLAEQNAVRDMGSSMRLGRAMNKLHKPKVDWLLVTLVIFALSLGFLPLYIAGETALYMEKLLHIAVAITIIISLYFADYRAIWKGRWMLLVAVFMGYVLFGLLGGISASEYRMLSISSFTVTNELFMPFFIIAWAAGLSLKKSMIKYPFVAICITTIFIAFEASVAVAVGYMLVIVGMICWSHHSLKEKLTLTAAALLSIAFVVYQSSFLYRVRVDAFLQPERYEDGPGYMTLLIEEVRAAAGMYGAKEPIDIPANTSDFALLNVLQHVGYSGLLVIGLVLGSLLLKLLWNARTIKQPFGRMLVQGAALYYGMNLLFALLALFGFSLFFSMHTPFLSLGFENLFVHAVLIGLVLSVYRRKSFEERMKPIEFKESPEPKQPKEPTTRLGKLLHAFFFIEE